MNFTALYSLRLRGRQTVWGVEGEGGAVTFSVRTSRNEVELVRPCSGMYGHLARPN